MIPTRFPVRPVLTLIAAIFVTQIVTAQVVWTGASGTDTNWTTGANWSTAGSPGLSDAVVFNNTGAVGTQGLVDNVVNSGFGGTISSLQYTNASNASVLLYHT